jgi:hypothetical protein
MINRKDKSQVARPSKTKEQLVEDMRRLASIGSKKTSKPSISNILKTERVGDRTFALVQEGKKYFIKYTDKTDNIGPNDLKYIGGAENRGKIDMFENYQRASNRLDLICTSLRKNILKEDINVTSDEDEKINKSETDTDETETDETETDETDTDETETDETETDETDTTLDGEDDEDIELDSNDDSSDITSDEDEIDLIDDLEDEASTNDDSIEGSSDMMSPEGGSDMIDDTMVDGGEDKESIDTSGSPEGEMPSNTSGSPEGDMNMGDGGEEPIDTSMPMDKNSEAENIESTSLEDLSGEEQSVDNDGNVKKDFQQVVGKIGQVVGDLKGRKMFDTKDIKNLMNTVITTIGDSFAELNDEEKEIFFNRIRKNGEEEKEEIPSELVNDTETKKELSEAIKKQAKLLLEKQILQKHANKKQQIINEIKNLLKK